MRTIQVRAARAAPELGERTLRRRAWWILAFFTVTLVVFGLGDVANGVQADPGITLAISGLSPDEVRAAEPTAFRLYDYATRSAGIVLTVLGLVLSAIVAGPYRQGQRWAWNTMWLLPAWAILVPFGYLAVGLAEGQPPAPPMVSGPIVAVVGAAALLVDRRRFGGAAAVRPAVAGA